MVAWYSDDQGAFWPQKMPSARLARAQHTSGASTFLLRAGGTQYEYNTPAVSVSPKQGKQNGYTTPTDVTVGRR